MASPSASAWAGLALATRRTPRRLIDAELAQMTDRRLAATSSLVGVINEFSRLAGPGVVSAVIGPH